MSEKKLIKKVDEARLLGGDEARTAKLEISNQKFFFKKMSRDDDTTTTSTTKYEKLFCSYCGGNKSLLNKLKKLKLRWFFFSLECPSFFCFFLDI